MDASGEATPLSKIIEGFVKANFSSLAPRLEEEIGKTGQKAIRWDRLRNVTFNVTNVPIYFSSKTVDASGVSGRAVIKSLQVRFKPVGFELGEPSSSAARGSGETSGPIFGAPGEGTSVFQEFPNAQLRMVVTATIDGIHGYESDHFLYSPIFTVFRLDRVGAAIGGQTITDVTAKLDTVRPGEKIDLQAFGEYITGDIAGGSVPPQAAAKLPVPTLAFTFTFSNDTIVLGLNDANTRFTAGIRDGNFATTGSDRFLVTVPEQIPMNNIHNPLRRGYVYAGVLVNARAFFNDAVTYGGLANSLRDELKKELLPIARAVYEDIRSVDKDALAYAYKNPNQGLAYTAADALAEALANKLFAHLWKTLTDTYGDDQATNQSEGGLQNRIVYVSRVLPPAAKSDYDAIYEKYALLYKKATTDVQRQDIARRFDAEVEALIRRHYSESFARAVWFDTIHPVKGVGVRLKQDDIIRGTGTLLDIPDSLQQFAPEDEDLTGKNKALAHMQLSGNPNIQTFAHDPSYRVGLESPELAWLDAQYTQLARYGSTIEGVVSLTNYGDLPITNFAVRMYLFNARTGGLLSEQALGYVHGTEYTFRNPAKTVSVDKSVLYPPEASFPGMQPLRDVANNPVRFLEPGKPVSLRIKFDIPTNDPVVLVVSAGARYARTIPVSQRDGYWEYLFEVERFNYFKSQDAPSMFVGFAPNKIITREIETKYGGGLVARFSIANGADAELQRQVQLHNAYGIDAQAPWKVPQSGLKDRITIMVLKPYDITIGGLTETEEVKGGYWVPGKVTEIEWERTIWNVDPKHAR
ncbi:MAG: hypothetical protein HSCHL_1461 [Hydrogenibacillus schlegelii]|uniref:Uncharacterized protein n=2 Tax=Hydrogenibacillus schlegelii TaxID=1484 RepID=A0A2T5G4Q9_HYDSH|nr:MAG: hypothetical protein HSCHL_1461 [Hydrogenibacillus schlegelii]